MHMDRQTPKKPCRRNPKNSSQEAHTAFRTERNADAIKHALLDNLCFNRGKTPLNATRNDWYLALAYTVRDRMMDQWIKTLQNFTQDVTIVSYVSAEFLMGPQLGINIINLGIYDAVFQATRELGLNLEELIEHEKEPGLGNGEIGMLASCSLDSLATLEVPSIGYGVRYEFGSFDQEIHAGWQVEMTNKWLQYVNPWEIPRPEITYKVNLGGHTESYYDEQNLYRVRWVPKFSIKGIAYDTPVSGYRTNATNLLRLWKSEAVESFDSDAYNVGDYFSAVNEKVASEAIGKILYPRDEPYVGKQLRLAQHYFSVSCALQDMIRLHLMRWKNINTFSSSFAVQLNDTPPSIAVAELMRLLVDEYLVSWDKAWYITQNTFSYTHHTLLPEDMEKWPIPLFAGILPRHLEIIYEINRRFLDEIWLKYPDDSTRLARLSLIEEGDQKYVRMAHLAHLGSHIINSVAEPCSESLKKRVFRDFYELYPEKFLNVTSGVTQRRWIVLSNPGLAHLITDTIGDSWIRSMSGEIIKLEQYADNTDFMKKWRRAKYENKRELAKIIHASTGMSVNPDSLFDIHVKRFHEYKRHHLNILHIITLYNRIKNNPQSDITPRTSVFGGYASPGYFMAKLIIKLINSVADVVNNDPDVAGRLRVVFFPNVNVKNAQKVYPAADLCEHISTAGREMSSAGNVIFSMNGALTIGTGDGVNIEIRDAVGAENFFTFGLTAEEVSVLKTRGYKPRDYYHADAELREAIDLISSGFFSKRDPELFKPLIDSLLSRDEHMLLADYQSYMDCQDNISKIFRDTETWAKMSILTVARMGKFSSDTSLQEYCDKIWLVKPFRSDAENIQTIRSP